MALATAINLPAITSRFPHVSILSTWVNSSGNDKAQYNLSLARRDTYCRGDVVFACKLCPPHAGQGQPHAKKCYVLRLSLLHAGRQWFHLAATAADSILWKHHAC